MGMDIDGGFAGDGEAFDEDAVALMLGSSMLDSEIDGGWRLQQQHWRE